MKDFLKIFPVGFKSYIFAFALVLSVMVSGKVSGQTFEKPLSYRVAEHYLKSFSDNWEVLQETTQSNVSSSIQDVRPENFSKGDVRKVIFQNMLNKSDQMQALQASMAPIYNKYVWKDLKLFYGTTTDPHYHLMSRINRTNTILGEAVLATWLATPTVDIDVLKYRQDVVKTLLNLPTVVKELRETICQYQEAEESVSSFWTETDPLYSPEYAKYMDSKFYKKSNNEVNHSAFALEWRKRLKRDFWDIQLNIIYPVMCTGYIKLVIPDGVPPIGLDKDGNEVSFLKFLLIGNIPLYGAYYKIDILHRLYKLGDPNASWVGPVVTFGMTEVQYLAAVYKAINRWRDYQATLRNLALRMADVQRFLVVAENVNNIVAQSSVLEAIYGKHLESIRQLLAEAHSDTDLGSLVKYLKSLPFSNWSYFFNNAGKLLACHKLFLTYKDVLINAFYELGQLDVYLSSTALMQEARTHCADKAYVFANFLDRKKNRVPYIQLEGMWNPFLDAKEAVPNGVVMDSKNGIRTLIVTGPNAGGKSTFITGIVNALVLAQTLGIVPAKKMAFTPFDKINTYIDISDDIASGKSLFMAEVDRAQQHIHMLQNLRKKEFSFTIFDEPFSGTNPKEGAAAEYSVLESLAKYENSLTLVATHYPKIMLLAQHFPDMGFANYKVYITRKKDSNSFNYTYKVVPGHTTQAIAIDILEKQGFNAAMLARAREILANPEKYQLDS